MAASESKTMLNNDSKQVIAMLQQLVARKTMLKQDSLLQFGLKKTTFYEESSLLKNNCRRVSNRVRLFIIKPLHIQI